MVILGQMLHLAFSSYSVKQFDDALLLKLGIISTLPLTMLRENGLLALGVQQPIKKNEGSYSCCSLCGAFSLIAISVFITV